MDIQSKEQQVHDFRKLVQEGFTAYLTTSEIATVLTGTDAEVWDIIDLKNEQLRQQNVRKKMRELYLSTSLVGTIEERLIDGNLYSLCKEDLTMPAMERMALQSQGKLGPVPIMTQTGKAGVLSFIQAGREHKATDVEIAKGIWIEMNVEGVLMYVNIKNI